LQAATSPDAIPVAAPLSARSGIQQSRPPATRAAQMGSMPARIAPAPARTAPAAWQQPRTVPRPPPARRGTPARPAPVPARSVPARRRAGAGCSFFLVLLVIMVIAFIVLGIVVDHGSGLGGG
jgi:cell division septation protein DedD